MKRTSRSIFAILIAIAMVFTTLPMGVFAESGDTPALGQSGTITGFDYIEPVEVEQGTAKADIPFPATVKATVQLDEVATPSQTQAGEISAQVTVGAWQIVSWQTYDPDTAERYVFEAVRESLTLPDSVILPDGVELPCVAVDVGEVEIGIAPTAQMVGAFTINDGLSAGTDYTYASNTLTIIKNGTYDIALAPPGGSAVTDKIAVATGVTATITLTGINIDVSGTNNACAFDIQGTANVTLILSGTNTLKSGNYKAGLHVPVGASVTIEGIGTLEANGGDMSAGIGSGYGAACGTIKINGGEVTATGRGGAAGIGGGDGGSGGTIEITGGTVIASSTTGASGIGSGSNGSGGTISIDFTGKTGASVYAKGTSGKSAFFVSPTLANIQSYKIGSGGTQTNGTYTYNSSDAEVTLYSDAVGGGSVTTYDYGLYVKSGTPGIFKNSSGSQGAEVTSDHSNITWDGSTLTLTDFEFKTSAATALLMANGGTINVSGENTLKSSGSGYFSNGINSNGSLTIEGVGALDVTAGDAEEEDGESYGIFVDNGTFTMNSGTLKVTAGKFDDDDGIHSLGIYVRNSASFALNGGTLIATGFERAISSDYTVPNGYSYWINAAAEPGGTETMSAGSAVIGSSHKYAKIIAVGGGTPDYALFVQTGESVIRKNDANGDPVTVSGMTWNGSTLAMNNVNFETSASFALNMKNGGTIALADGTTNSLKSGGGSDTYGISSEKALVITGTSGILKVTAGDATAKSTGMMLTEGITVSGGTVEVTAGTASNDKVGVMSIGTTTITGNGKLIAKGASMAFFSQGGEPDAVAVGSTSIDGSGKTSATWASMYYNISGANAKYIELTAGSGGTAIDGGSDELVFNNSTLTHASKQTELNALRASGTNMPNGSTSKWNIISGTLYLNNFEFTTSNLLALDVTGANGKISVAGSNSFTSTYNGSAYSMGLNVDNGLTISGSGSLNATAGTSTGNSSEGIYVGSGNLTIEGSATVKAMGGSATSNSTGITVNNGDLIVSGTATVNATAGASSNSHSDGVSAKTVTVSGGILNAVAGTSHTDSQSRGIYFTTTISVTGSGKITAKSNQYAIRGGSSVTVPAAAVKGTTDGATTGLSNASWNTSTKTYVVSGTTAKYVEMAASGGGGTAPTITTASLPDGTVGTGYSQTLAATGDATITWSIDSGSLPTGITLSGSTISGTPTTAGTSNFTVKATNSAGSATKSLSVTINAAPTVTVTSVTIKTAPTKTTYTAGETLDLTGLVVTLNKSDTTTEDVAFADFGTKNITTNPANGTALTTSNTSVTITYTPDNKSVNQAITVNAQTYTVSGTVVDHNNSGVNGATVTIMLGNETKGTQTTQSGGTFSFTNITPGLYNLVITTSDGSQKITVIVTVTNANVTVPATSTKLPQYIQNSEVEVTQNAPVQAVVGGLPEVFDTPVTDDTKGFTQTELTAIAGGGTGEIKVVVDEIQATADQTAIENAASGKTVGLFLDLSVFKTVTDSGGNTISDNQLTELPSLLTITFDLPTSLQGKTISAIYRVHGNGVDTITTSGAEYFSQSGNTITLHVKKFSTYGLAYTNTNPPTPTPTPSDGSSGGGSSKQDSAPAPNPWLEPNPAQTLATSANKAQQDSIRTKSTDTYGVRKASWPKMNGYRYYHDTMEGNAVQVRLYVDNPTAMKRDILVTGFVKGSIVDSRKAFLEKWFSNKIRVIHMDEIEPWGQNVRIAAKVDLANMDTKKLYFYSYDKKANKYTRITEPKYWIDKNGYLHFYTTYAGDIIISENPLEKR